MAEGQYCVVCGQYILEGQMHTCPVVYYVGGQYCYRCGEFYLNGVFHSCRISGTSDTSTYTYSYVFIPKSELDSLKNKIEELEKGMKKLDDLIAFQTSVLTRLLGSEHDGQKHSI